MNNYLYCLLLISCQGLVIANASAEIYQWTDKHGKIHYSDKKPTVAHKDITARMQKSNIDTSTAEHQKLETIFRRENAADRAYWAQQAMPNSAAEDQAKRCKNARNTLAKLEGPVEFTDDNGKVIKTSEQEREARAQNMRNVVTQLCSGS